MAFRVVFNGSSVDSRVIGFWSLASKFPKSNVYGVGFVTVMGLEDIVSRIGIKTVVSSLQCTYNLSGFGFVSEVLFVFSETSSANFVVAIFV